MKVKRKNKIQLASEHTKRLKLEKEVQISKEAVKKEVLGRRKVQNELAATKDELRTVRKLNDQLTKCNKRLSYAVISQDKLQRRKRRDISTLSRQQQWSQKKQVCANVNQALLFLEDEGVHATSVTLVHTETSQKEVLDLHQSTYSKPDESSSTDESLEVVLYVKERFGLSDSAYHELSMVCQHLPRSWKLKNLAKQLNSKWQIIPCPGGNGVQQSLESRLRERVNQLVQERKVSAGDKLQVKLSGDGTKVCRKLNLINFTFTLLNEGDLAKSPKGNHTIVIISAIEGYDTLKTALSDICEEAQRLTSIEVNGMTFPVEYFLGSDLKFLVIVCGIESATCTYACVWCTCSSSERHDMAKEWSITHPEQGARTIVVSCPDYFSPSGKIVW